MENKKKNKGLIGVVIVLILLVLSLSGYIIYDKVNEKASDKKEDKNIIEKKEELSIASEEVTGLMKKISISDIDTSLTGWYYQNDKITVDDMDNQIKLIIGLQNALKDTQTIVPMESVPIELVDTAIKSVFGNSVKYKNEDIKAACHGTAANYNSKTKSYDLVGGCGGMFLPLYKEKISKAFKTEKTIEIYQKAIYVEFDPSDEEDEIVKENIYKTDRKTEIKKGILSEENMDYSNYFDLSDEFKFTFTKEENNYYFSSVEKVN